MDAAPQWVVEHNLRRIGLYYEGYVDDIVLDLVTAAPSIILYCDIV